MNDRTLSVVSVDGPFTRRPSGKFRNGTPIMTRCKPYWVVRVLHGTVLHDYNRYSAASAESFAEGIRAGTIREEWSSGTGFMLVGG